MEDALASMRWRGPDGCRLETCGEYWLGVARLAISDPAAGQPLRCEASGRMIAFNGAVTSAVAEGRTAGPGSGNDAELLLARMRERGEAALLDHCGPYAFAVVDPDRDQLWRHAEPDGERRVAQSTGDIHRRAGIPVPAADVAAAAARGDQRHAEGGDLTAVGVAREDQVNLLMGGITEPVSLPGAVGEQQVWFLAVCLCGDFGPWSPAHEVIEAAHP